MGALLHRRRSPWATRPNQAIVLLINQIRENGDVVPAFSTFWIVLYSRRLHR